MNDSMNRVDELTLKLLDVDVVDEREIVELATLLKGDREHERFLHLMQMEGCLRAIRCESTRHRLSDNLISRLQDERQARLMDGVMAVIHDSAASELKPAPRRVRASSGLRIAVVATVAVAILAAFFSSFPDASEPQRVATFLAPSGGFEVSTVGEAERWLPIDAGDELPLAAGQVVRTNGVGSYGQIRYLDGTTIDLTSDVSVRLKRTANGSKCLAVRSGAIEADVRPQPPGRPLIIETDAAVMEVIGTKLVVSASASSACLDVLSGRVAMIRRADGKRLEVPAGHSAQASKSKHGNFASEEFAKVPDQWQREFTSGLPEGWHRGELHTIDGRSAVRAIPFVHKKNPLRFGITSENAWGLGRYALFQLHEDSVLHLKVRLQSPAPIRVMINPRPYSPDKSSVGGNLYYEDIAAGMMLNDSQWHTVSVPLSDISFYGAEGRKQFGSPGLEGLAAYVVHLTTLGQDAGLLVDQMWVTREGDPAP